VDPRRAFSLILQAHKFYLVYHTHTSPFCVPLNERESQGGRTGCPAQLFFALQFSNLESPSCTHYPTSTEYQNTLRKILQLFWYASHGSLSLHNVNPNNNTIDRSLSKARYVLHQLNDQCVHVWELLPCSVSRNQTLEATIAATIHQLFSCDEYNYVCQQVTAASSNVIPQELIQIRLNL
jgi:hypothetical protein